MEKKKCNLCNKEYTRDYYYKVHNKKTGSVYEYPYCKYCHYQKYTKHSSAKWRKENPEKWNKLAAKNFNKYRKRLPGGVYCILTPKGLYVGSTAELKLRIMQHKNTNNQESICRKFNTTFMGSFILSRTDNKETRIRKEKEWIEKLQPALNKEWNKKVWYKDGKDKQYHKVK